MRGALAGWDPGESEAGVAHRGGGGIGGGTVTTAGNLVFQVINDGRFRAVTADKGEILYEIQTGRTGMAPPITYEVDGKQYVAFQGGLGRLATIVGPNDAKVEQPADDVCVRAGRHGRAAHRCSASAAAEPAQGGRARKEP